MRIGLTIGGLGSGGAEMQLMRLAVALQNRGHQVQVYCYTRPSEYDEGLRAQGVEVVAAGMKGRLGKIRQMRRWMHDFRPDIVHASMKRASVLAVLARGISRKVKVLASDMSTATYNRRSLALWPALLIFGGAHGVVTQTELNRKSLQTLAPWLRGKVSVVRNGLDTEIFRPGPGEPAIEPFRFCVVGSVYAVKNPALVVAAVAELRRRGVGGFRVDWYGRRGLAGDSSPSEDYRVATESIVVNALEPWLTFHGETREILRAYQSSHALIHVSVQEGFPNAVVEAMSCGLPIIASPVSDLPQIVAEADNGWVVDAKDASSLADAMQKMIDLDPAQRFEMGQRSRRTAVSWFSKERFVDEYIALYQSLLTGRSVQDETQSNYLN
ncbi:MAG: glycosyltransferase family 4 protein [Xanthomonadales bacterium]|nr:glycosyltransferase family 4 protein [Xanthomonadales bacterium]